MNPKILKLSAAGLLLGSAGWAYTVIASAPPPGPDVARIRLMADRLHETASAPALSLEVPTAQPVAQPALSVKKDAAKKPAAATSVKQPVKTVAVPPRVPAAPLPPPAPVPAEDPNAPVKSLALVGITHAENTDFAWLMDLNSQNREAVRLGESAFGFRLAKVDADQVSLERSGQQYVLRLGEKPVPTNDLVASASTGDDEFGGGFGGPGGGRGGRGGMNGFGGRGGQGGFGGRGGFGQGGFGGRGSFGQGGFGGRGNSGGRGNFGGGTPTTFGGGGNGGSNGGGFSGGSQASSSGRSGSRSGSGFAGNRAGFTGNRGGFTGGFGGNFGGGGFSSQFSSSAQGGATASTSNPQTARRNGSRLVGGGSMGTNPAPISNPQTQRRLGTSAASQGQAFGQQQSGSRQNGFGQGNLGARQQTNRLR